MVDTTFVPFFLLGFVFLGIGVIYGMGLVNQHLGRLIFGQGDPNGIVDRKRRRIAYWRWISVGTSFFLIGCGNIIYGGVRLLSQSTMAADNARMFLFGCVAFAAIGICFALWIATRYSTR